MTYVTDQTSQEIRAHMRRLKAMKGWNEPLADRLYKEILDLDEEVRKLRAAQAAPPAPRRLTEAEITLLVEAYYEDVGSAPPDLIQQVERVIFGGAAQPAQAPQNHVWLVSNRVASMHFWSEDKARKTASGTGSLWMDVSRIDLLDVASQPAQMPAGYVLVPVEPTEEMLHHFCGTRFRELSPGKQQSELIAYRAMIAAAPDTSQKEQSK